MIKARDFHDEDPRLNPTPDNITHFTFLQFYRTLTFSNYGKLWLFKFVKFDNELDFGSHIKQVSPIGDTGR